MRSAEAITAEARRLQALDCSPAGRGACGAALAAMTSALGLDLRRIASDVERELAQLSQLAQLGQRA